MINPTQLIQMAKGGNPQQMIIDAVKKQTGNNPVLNNAIEMAENHDAKGLENLARNLCKTNGLNADDIVNQVRSQFGMK